MIGLDTNVLARYYIDSEEPGTRVQQEAARRLIESGQPLTVCKTVILELEWVMCGYYGLHAYDFLAVLRHLLCIPNLEVEVRETPAMALANKWRPLMTGNLPGAQPGWACRLK
jgi:predicted nucleic-acid-binding protein